MTNDDAREASVEEHTPAETCYLLSRDLVRSGWDDCMAHLRATGQLCTPEERDELRERVRVAQAWALSRIEHCRREEAKFAAATTSAKSSVMVEAATERRALQAMLKMLQAAE